MQTETPRVVYPISRALALTLVAAVIGLLVGLFAFPSFPASLMSIGWKVGTIGVLLVAVRVFEHRRADARDAGLSPVRGDVRSDRARVAVPAIAFLVLLSAAWSSIPGLNSLASSGSGSSYDAGTYTLPLLIFEIVIRYPITVVSEESFFRGFLQPRVAKAGPVVVGVLFALYHLLQWRTIPSLLPLAIALSLVRWWLGSIWPGAVLHYAGNVLFALSLYRS